MSKQHDYNILERIPSELFEAAAKIAHWFDRHNVETWALGGVQSRRTPEAKSHERLLQILEDAGIEVCYEAIEDELVPVGVAVDGGTR